MANILIAGCGYVATALGSMLAMERHTGWGLRRHPTTLSTRFNWLAQALGVPPTRPGESSKTRTARHPANKRCRNAKLVASGYTFRYPTFREGYMALLTGQAGAR